MIRSLAFRRSSLDPIASTADTSGKFGKTEYPCFPHLASSERIGTRNAAPGEFNEKTPANSDELGGFLSRYERFGHHDKSSGERLIASGEHVHKSVRLSRFCLQALETSKTLHQ